MPVGGARGAWSEVTEGVGCPPGGVRPACVPASYATWRATYLRPQHLAGSCPDRKPLGLTAHVGGTAGVRPHGLDSRRHAGGVSSRICTQPRTAAGRRLPHRAIISSTVGLL